MFQERRIERRLILGKPVLPKMGIQAWIMKTYKMWTSLSKVTVSFHFQSSANLCTKHFATSTQSARQYKPEHQAWTNERFSTILIAWEQALVWGLAHEWRSHEGGDWEGTGRDKTGRALALNNPLARDPKTEPTHRLPFWQTWREVPWFYIEIRCLWNIQAQVV